MAQEMDELEGIYQAVVGNGCLQREELSR
jgi:hypothetical protein